MQKGKHPGGPTQGYPSRNFSPYPGNPDNTRQFSIRDHPPGRVYHLAPSYNAGGEVNPAFHASGTPGGGPGMRGMHHAPPTQPPTPPTSQDMKQQQSHMPPQAHQIPTQQGGQLLGPYGMPGAGRGSNQQPSYYPQGPRGPAGQTRMTHSRSVVMPNNSQYMQPFQVYSAPLVPNLSSQQPLLFTSPHMNHQSFQQRIQGNGPQMYPPQTILLPQHSIYPPYPQQQVYFTSSSIQQIPRTGGSGPVPSSQGAVPPQPPPGSMAMVPGPGGVVPAPPVQPAPKPAREKRAIKIVDPVTGVDIVEEMNRNSTPPRSGESSARQTPQPNFGQNTDRTVAAEFATKVAMAARSGSESTNSSSLQQASSRTSNYSENESQASPDPHDASPSKLDTSVESISSESQIIENNIPYDANQQAAILRGWTMGPGMEPLGPMLIHHPGMMIPDDLMRAGPPNPPPREYAHAAVPNPWMPEGNPMPVPVIINEKPPAPMEAPIRQVSERVIPTVSALAHAPTVDIPPRHTRDQFPALGKGHQQPSPVKRKPRSDQTQEQSESKAKDQSQQQHQQPTPPQQLSQQQQPQLQQQLPPTQPPSQLQQQPHPPKLVTQSKPKPVTPMNECKKQTTPPSQDSEEYVQSIQTKSNEQKTIMFKKNDSDTSDSKSKPSDSIINKENNNLETRNLNEEIVQENNNRNKSEVIKCDAPVTTDSSLPTSQPEATSKINATEETREEESSTSAPVSEDGPGTVEDESSAKANGEAISDDAKSNNQKSKNSNKRQPQPSQPNMRLDNKKETRNVEVKTPVSDASPIPTPPAPETKIPPTVVVNCEQPATEEELKTKNEIITDEDKEKEKEDLMVAAKNEENNKQTASMKTNDSSHAQVIENVNKAGVPVLKHNYKDGQWSPINLEGKKKYDKEFIMSLMHDPQSKKRPQNLPEFLELLKDNNKQQRPTDKNFFNNMSRGHQDILMPNFANKNSSQRAGQTGITKRLSAQGSKQKQTKPPVIHMSLSLQQDVKLHEAENAWKPARVVDGNNMTDEETKTDVLYKRVRGVLNKLTPQKFNKLVEQVKALPIDNLPRLQGVIDLVFKKAVDEPSFSVAYAQMCKILQKMGVPSGDYSEDGSPILVNFRKLLIDKCQHEFEKNTAAELKRDERLKEINVEQDPEKKKMLQLTFEDEERRIRMKSLGNIRFIGELYKLNMLTARIMHSCINNLLNGGDEESLECLCKLLTTVGQGLEKSTNDDKKNADAQVDDLRYQKQNSKRGDRDADKERDIEDMRRMAARKQQDAQNQFNEFNGYFKRLEQIVKSKGTGASKVSSRVRFMIQDLIDLRNNKWIPRRDDSNPKTIDQIQKEADREIMDMNIALNSPQERKRQENRNMMDNRKRGPDSQGWTTVTSTTPSRGKFVVEGSKLRVNQDEMEITSLGNRNQFLWGQGAMGAKVEEKRSISSNMFAALETEKISEPSSRSSSLKGTSSFSEKEKISSYKPNAEDGSRSSRSGSQHGPGSRSSSKDSVSSLKRDDRRYPTPTDKVQPSPAPAAVPVTNAPKEPLGPEQVKKKAKLLLDEYLNEQDLNEATLSLKESFDESSFKDFIMEITYEAFEKKGDGPKHAVGTLLSHFIKNNDISKEQYLEGLSGVLETLEDLEIDMPFVWEYLGEIIVHLCSAEVLTLRDVSAALAQVKGTSGSAKFLKLLLKVLGKEKGNTWLEQKWIVSNISLEDIIKPEHVENFVKENNLEFLFNSKVLTMETIRNEIRRMITAKESFDSIKAWVDQNVGPDRSSTPEFVKTLVTAILDAAVTKQQSVHKIDENLLVQCDPLIRIYTDNKEDCELPCLYAVQAFVHKLEHPQGLLHQIFEFFLDHDLIAIESFKLWRDSEDPHEREGHAVCTKSLTSFFTLLDENDTDEDTKS